MNTRQKKQQVTGPGMKCAAALFLLLLPAAAFALEPGDRLPAFSVPAENSRISSQDIAGRVAIITCEAKGTAELNRPFKKAVQERWRQSPDADPAIVPVINCFGFFGLAASICASRVAAAAKKEKLVLYTDNSGDMFRDFGAAGDQSTIIIADKKGIVRFVHAGRLDPDGVKQAVQLIEGLLKK